MRFRNFTPHVIHLIDDEDNIFLIIPSEGVIRVQQTQTIDEWITTVSKDKIPILKTVIGGVRDLPPPEEGVLIIVSSIVRNFMSERFDLVSPSTLVRDRNGVIVGCKTLTR